MGRYFYFGEKIDGYDVKVLNEREIRAGAGILFLFAIIIFTAFCGNDDIEILNIFITLFLIEFTIRVLINPRYAPSLILGRIFVSNQTPEYTGAPQKRFAWGIGLILAMVMFLMTVIGGEMGPINALLCLFCLVFLFFESAFGICLGCKIYNKFNKEKAKLCPGGVCEAKEKEQIQKISTTQIILVVVYILITVFIIYLFKNILPTENTQADSTIISEDCKIPSIVKAIGHEDTYKENHGCLLED